MNVIILDNQDNLFEELSEMTNLYPINISLKKASSFEELNATLKINTFHSIFINCTNLKTTKQAEKLSKQYPNEKFFLLCDKFYCTSNPLLCDNCNNNKNKFVIIKPLNQQQLTKIFSKSYSCESKYMSPKEFKIERIKKIINEKYPYIKFDYMKNEDSYSFIADNIPSYTLLHIADLLKEEEFQFEIKDINKILIS